MVTGCPGVLGGVGYIPKSISSLRLWVAADFITGLSDGTGVETWSDLSGNGYHATQATEALRPIYKTNIINGKPVLRFASGQFLGITGYPTSDAAGTGIMVIDLPADPPALDNAPWHFSSSALGILLPRTTGNYYDSFGTTNRYDSGNPTISMANPTIYCVQTQLNSWINYLNNGENYASVSNTVGWTATPWIGKTHEGRYMTGDIAELIIYGKWLSVAEKLKIHQYLATKYNITLV